MALSINGLQTSEIMNYGKTVQGKLPLPKGTSKMKYVKKRARFATSLSLILSLGLLTACAGIRVKVATDCSWAEPIEISNETLDYLIRDEAPRAVVDELNDIADHNDLYKKFC